MRRVGPRFPSNYAASRLSPVSVLGASAVRSSPIGVAGTFAVVSSTLMHASLFFELPSGDKTQRFFTTSKPRVLPKSGGWRRRVANAVQRGVT